MNPYQQLALALAPDGIQCHFQSPGQMVISSQVGPVWPNRGNSFWVTHVADRWYLFTWSPVGYRIPETADVAALCRSCMAHESSAMGSVPTPIAQAFGLNELSDQEEAAVYAEMDMLT